MKNNIFFLIFLMSVGFLFAQEKQTVKSNWLTISETKELLISKRIVQFDDLKNGMHREYVQFKYKNKTTLQLFVSWYFNAKYSNSQVVKLDDENYRAFLLEPNQEFIPDFSNQKEKMFFVFKQMTDMPNKPHLESITIDKLKTNPIK